MQYWSSVLFHIRWITMIKSKLKTICSFYLFFSTFLLPVRPLSSHSTCGPKALHDPKTKTCIQLALLDKKPKESLGHVISFPTFLQQWELPVFPLQAAGVKDHPRSSGSGTRSPWASGAGRLGTPTGGNSAPCGRLPQTRCPASAGEHLWRYRGLLVLLA